MPPVLCLLPSPLTGPATWRPVASRLTAAGWAAAEAPDPAAAPRTVADVLDWLLAGIPADREVVLVPHSNAGLYVPLLAQQRHVTGYVFVDAGLPGREAGSVPVVPGELYDLVAAKADQDGLLPPWTSWWDPAEVAGLFPDAAVRESVQRAEPRLPLSYLRESVRVPPGWDARPGAYLAFGDAYAPERADARSRGWPVLTLAGEHLHMLVDPERVAAEITGLLR